MQNTIYFSPTYFSLSPYPLFEKRKINTTFVSRGTINKNTSKTLNTNHAKMSTSISHPPRTRRKSNIRRLNSATSTNYTKLTLSPYSTLSPRISSSPRTTQHPHSPPYPLPQSQKHSLKRTHSKSKLSENPWYFSRCRPNTWRFLPTCSRCSHQFEVLQYSWKAGICQCEIGEEE